ncbi:glycosyltransferase [Enterococcus gallinarum]|uniref:glycosyltransferase n=1 Tax=Enterococcus gallinarum TaxID=1353 RepID=UPI001898144F|nr:glycosyltransferase [Enterococcus gallinarum]MEB5880307.1 glycosyltransferase [Enterococcus gallinarum]
MKSNKVSVLLATYNGEDYIRDQLESLKIQSYNDFNVIIKDDNSTDNTVKIIEEFINYNKLYSWYLYKNKTNVGWRKNFRDLLDECDSEYMFFCDQDDIWEQKKIELCIEQFKKNSKIKVLITDYVEFFEKKGKEEPPRKLKVNSKNKVFFSQKNWFNSRPGCCMAINKDVKNLIVGLIDDSDYTLPHDAASYMIGEITDALYLLPYELTHWRKHISSTLRQENQIRYNKKKYYHLEKNYIDTRLEFSRMLLNFFEKNYKEFFQFTKDTDRNIQICKAIYNNRKNISNSFYTKNKYHFFYLIPIFDNKSELKNFFLGKVLNK